MSLPGPWDVVHVAFVGRRRDAVFAVVDLVEQDPEALRPILKADPGAAGRVGRPVPVDHVLRENHVRALLAPQACLLVLVGQVLAHVHVVQGVHQAGLLGVDLQAVAAVVEHHVAHDPHVIGVVPQGDAVVVFVRGGLPVAVVVDLIVVEHDLLGGGRIVFGVPAPGVQPRAGSAHAVSHLGVAHHDVVTGSEHGNAAVRAVEVHVLDDHVAARQIYRRLHLGRRRRVCGQHEHRAARRTRGLDRDAAAGVGTAGYEHRRPCGQRLRNRQTRLGRCALGVRVVRGGRMRVVHVVEVRVRCRPRLGSRGCFLLDAELRLRDRQRPSAQTRRAPGAGGSAAGAGTATAAATAAAGRRAAAAIATATAAAVGAVGAAGSGEDRDERDDCEPRNEPSRVGHGTMVQRALSGAQCGYERFGPGGSAPDQQTIRRSSISRRPWCRCWRRGAGRRAPRRHRGRTAWSLPGPRPLR